MWNIRPYAGKMETIQVVHPKADGSTRIKLRDKSNLGWATYNEVNDAPLFYNRSSGLFIILNKL